MKFNVRFDPRSLFARDLSRDLGVGEASWSFKTDFDVTAEDLEKPFADLVFEGLDTFATVSLVSPSEGVECARSTATDDGFALSAPTLLIIWY